MVSRELPPENTEQGIAGVLRRASCEYYSVCCQGHLATPTALPALPKEQRFSYRLLRNYYSGPAKSKTKTCAYAPMLYVSGYVIYASVSSAQC